MATYTVKQAVERDERFVNSWQENAPESKFADMTLAEFKAEGKLVTDKIDEIKASDAHTKSLKIELKNLIKVHMKSADYVARDVSGDRAFGPDSALYGGFGYIRESEKKHGGGRKPDGTTNG